MEISVIWFMRLRSCMKSLQCRARGKENKKRRQRSPVLAVWWSFCRTLPTKQARGSRRVTQGPIRAMPSSKKPDSFSKPVPLKQDKNDTVQSNHFSMVKVLDFIRAQINPVISNINRKAKGIFMAFGLCLQRKSSRILCV